MASGDELDLTRFAVELYGRDGVRSACLVLQDRLAVDVNLVLLGAYVGAVLRVSLTATQVRTVHGRSAAWHDEVVSPLRMVRRRLVTGPPPAPGDASDALRVRLKELELLAEQLELDDLARQLARWPTVASSTRPPAELAASCIRAVLDGCAARPVEEADVAAVRVIAEAAARP